MTAARTKRKYAHFKAANSPRDELTHPAAGEASPYAPVLEIIESLSPAELHERQDRLERSARDVGIHFGVIEEGKPREADWRLDVLPRIIPRDEWELLREGILQRARAFNAFIRDMHGGQDILRQRALPHGVALGDPAFQRPLTTVDVPGGQYCHIGAFDLVRGEDGMWRVLENHMATSFGLSFVMQNRRMLAQAFPELFQSMDISPVAPFITQFSENLRAASGQSNPHIVLLTRGETNQAYFDESFLARQLGIAMVRPADLLIREGKVFLKTIRGLEQVDLIYRRLASAAIDPIAFAESGLPGIPGIVNCVRNGTVRFVNALGCGVADNRALLRFSRQLIGFYLHEHAILDSVPTFNCGDRDQFDYILSNKDEMVLKPIQDSYTLFRYLGGKQLPEKRSHLMRLARKWPHLFVAQPYLHPSQLPCYASDGFKSHSVYLRVFFQLGEKPSVLPGGLTRQSWGSHRDNPLTIMSEGMKDTWVPAQPFEYASTPGTVTLNPDEYSISSRLAEGLYWTGRYLERMQNTARQLNILETLRWDQLGRAAQRSYWPLWKAVAAANGQSGWSKRKSPPKDTLSLTRALVLQANEPASILSSATAAYMGAQHIRDSISPEVWQVLSEFYWFLQEAARQTKTSRTRLREICQRIVDDAARLAGTADRTMLHDDSWQFFRIGSFVERAQGTATVVREVLSWVMATRAEGNTDEADLTSLLRLLTSLDAYRREFRSRAYLERVVNLLLQNACNPSSVSHCLRQLRYAIGTLSVTDRANAPTTLDETVDKIIAKVESLPLQRLMPSSVRELDHGVQESAAAPRPEMKFILESLTRELEMLHERLEDTFFSHQTEFYPDRQLPLDWQPDE